MLKRFILMAVLMQSFSILYAMNAPARTWLDVFAGRIPLSLGPSIHGPNGDRLELRCVLPAQNNTFEITQWRGQTLVSSGQLVAGGLPEDFVLSSCKETKIVYDHNRHIFIFVAIGQSRTREDICIVIKRNVRVQTFEPQAFKANGASIISLLAAYRRRSSHMRYLWNLLNERETPEEYELRVLIQNPDVPFIRSPELTLLHYNVDKGLRNEEDAGSIHPYGDENKQELTN